jgi:hypothetical protein
MAVLNQIEEGAMHARVVGKFRMESGSHHSSLPDGDRIGALGSNHLHVRSYALNFWCADENHLQWRVSQFASANGAVDLTAVGIATNTDIENTQSHLFWIFHFVGQQNSAGASTKSRFDANKLLQLFKSLFAQQVQKRSTLAAGDDKTVDLVQLFRLSHHHNFRTQLLEPFAVGIEIALESQNADFHNKAKDKPFNHIGHEGTQRKPCRALVNCRFYQPLV